MGYTAHWTTGFLAYEPEARQILGLSEPERVIAVIHIGTPTVPVVDRPRPDAAKLTTRWAPPP
jgi:hypothetical protein